MFLLGLLSIVQIVFLPGYLVLRLVGLTGGLLRTCLWSFGLSLVLNHFLVLGLVLLGSYHSSTLYVVFAAEAAIALWLARGVLTTAWVLPRFWRNENGLRRVMWWAAWAVIIGYTAVELARLGSIFVAWDAVVSWNRWALDWAANRLPRMTWEYPQLLPSNGSLTYVFMQDTSVWIFAKGFMFLFPLGVLLAILDMYRATKHFGYVAGTIFAYGLLVSFLRFRNLSCGYADVPVAFLATASIHALVWARQASQSVERKKLVILGAVLAAGAALTKQAGVPLVAVYPLLAWLLVSPRRDEAGDQPECSWLWTVACTSVVTIGLAAPWYVYKQWEIRAGRDQSNLMTTAVHIHAGRTLPQRAVHAVRLLGENVPYPVLGLIALLVLVSLVDPIQRWIVLLVVVPIYLCWSLGFSYEARNLALAIPLIAAAAGVGLVQSTGALLSQKGSPSAAQGIPLGKPGYVLATLALVAGVLASRVPREQLVARQLRLQRQVGVAALNAKLYEYAAQTGLDGAVLAGYPFLAYLPDLSGHYVASPTCELASFRKAYAEPGVRFALFQATHIPSDVRDFLADPAGDGHSRLLWESQGYQFWGKCVISPGPRRLERL